MNKNYIENLVTLDLRTIRKQLKRQGYTLRDAEEIVSTPGGSVSSVLTWRNQGGKVLAETGWSLKSRDGGFYLVLSYTQIRGIKETPTLLWYRLIRKDSNLKPGSYVYYILDPYSDSSPGLCRKLYLYRGIFYPRSVISGYGIRYKQQTEGHTQRRVWTFYEKANRYPDPKNRKFHYRGKETPFGRRFNYLQEEGDFRMMEYLTKKVSPAERRDYFGIIRDWMRDPPSETL